MSSTLGLFTLLVDSRKFFRTPWRVKTHETCGEGGFSFSQQMISAFPSQITWSKILPGPRHYSAAAPDILLLVRPFLHFLSCWLFTNTYSERNQADFWHISGTLQELFLQLGIVHLSYEHPPQKNPQHGRILLILPVSAHLPQFLWRQTLLGWKGRAEQVLVVPTDNLAWQKDGLPGLDSYGSWPDQKPPGQICGCWFFVLPASLVYPLCHLLQGGELCPVEATAYNSRTNIRHWVFRECLFHYSEPKTGFRLCYKPKLKQSV